MSHTRPNDAECRSQSPAPGSFFCEVTPIIKRVSLDTFIHSHAILEEHALGHFSSGIFVNKPSNREFTKILAFHFFIHVK